MLAMEKESIFERQLLRGRFAGFPDAFKVDKISSYRQFRDRCLQYGGCAFQFSFQVLALLRGIVLERGQSAVSAAVGVDHQQYIVRSMQSHRPAKLLQDELPVALLFRMRKTFGSAGHANRIRALDPQAFQELA